MAAMFRAATISAISLLAIACSGPSGDDGTGPDGGGDVDAAVYPPPDDDVVAPIGSATTLDLASWNIENFPRAEATPKMVADLIASMELDIVAVQEIENIAAWDELVARLPDHDGVLSSHTYGNGTFQKVGYIYRAGMVTMSGGTQLFDNDGFEFPRPPLQVVATIDDGVRPAYEIVIITLHLKAGRGFDDRQRREAAMVTLEGHVRTTASGIDPDVVILGDFNEIVTETAGRAVFDPFLNAPTLYSLETEELADGGTVTFVPSGSMLDHAITTASIGAARTAVEVPKLNQTYAPYNGSVSDHLPVVVSFD